MSRVYGGEGVVSVAEGYRKMVAQAAWKTWRKLPPHTRIWLSIEDLIQDGMNWVVTVGIPKYRQDQASLCTFLYIGIGNYFKGEYLKSVYAEKRYEGRTVSLEELDLMGVDDKQYDLETRVEALRSDKDAEKTLRGCWAVPMVVRIFKKASELLRRELKKWFLGMKNSRLHMKKCRFWVARMEFLELAEKEGLEYDDCYHILSSPGCLGELKFSISGI